MHKTNSGIRKQHQRHEQKIKELENRSRWSNLIVYGVEEQQNESFQKLDNFVSKAIFEGTVNIKTAGTERIHQVGRTKRE